MLFSSELSHLKDNRGERKIIASPIIIIICKRFCHSMDISDVPNH